MVNFTIRLNAGKPEKICQKNGVLKRNPPQIGNLVAMFHIERRLTALVLIFMLPIHIGGGEREVILRNIFIYRASYYYFPYLGHPLQYQI